MTLRGRLTLFYTVLLTALLFLLAVLVLSFMQTRLIGSIKDDLEKNVFGQINRLVLPTTPFSPANPLGRLGSSGFGSDSGDTNGPTLSALRQNFPNYRIQIEGLTTSIDDIQSMMQGSPAERAAELGFMQATAAQSRLTVGIDPNAPVQLSDAEFAQLLDDPSRGLEITAPTRAAFDEPVPTQVYVRLAEVQTGYATGDNSPLTQAALIYVGRNLQPTYDTLDRLRSLMLVLFVGGLIVSSVGAYLLSGQALRPLIQVQRAAEQIGGQNLSARVPEPKTRDEVQALALALNRMLGRLEGSFEAQRRFTSDASHELRTPVTAISGHASYLLRRTNPSEGQRESLTIIRSEAERLTNLISSLLELARSDGGVMTLRRQPVLPKLLLGDIARELQPLAQAQHAELKVSGSDDALEGDPDRLKQVIINLVSNALKAGASRVELSSRLATGESGESGVQMSVSDDGPGIAPEHLERLFDRFYRVEESRSRDQGGAGLGLAIARSIVDAHGGRIWFESEVGRGTTVNVWLSKGRMALVDDDVA
ncbi:HAMP domain-containing histidine kinase [Deinococcus detaillensis]|uniref:histidine kinase n=1 Tax=Deinococcus detaillensis TaxID=2592048 RepID=A0A553V430_9DEIO|nr:HAMP domain-containing sensor histidine kinase [Deinococcus detaillensis]TSA87202.1 HAMP domain-containing histidine kinase [Deinococcus detaillensis]